MSYHSISAKVLTHTLIRRPEILIACLVATLCAASVLAESSSADQNKEAPAKAAQVYGDGLDGGEKVEIAEVLAAPEAFTGRTVQVEGEIIGVCPKKGCWMELRDGDVSLRVKVEDDVIIFPADAVGQRAVAQGQIEIRDMDRESYEGWMRHLAEEQGAEFDASSIGDGPYRLVQLRGSGAEISG